MYAHHTFGTNYHPGSAIRNNERVEGLKYLYNADGLTQREAILSGVIPFIAGGVMVPRKPVTFQFSNKTSKNTVYMSPDKIHYSQESISYAKKRSGIDSYTVKNIIDSMDKNGWVGPPIDVVQMKEGFFTSVDNTRIFSAKKSGIDVKVNIRKYNENLPADMVNRFEHPKIHGNYAKTWGEAIEFRIIKQSNKFANTFYPIGVQNDIRITNFSTGILK